jgi:hypothetical protein
LFSRDSVADFINRSFEPVWQSVRPVPIIRIDFGNGKVLTRTLHGNILTSVCTSDGRLVDALPGIYQEKAYLQALAPLEKLAREVSTLPAERRDARLLTYHLEQTRLLIHANFEVARRDLRTVAVTKRVIERPVERVVQPDPRLASRGPNQNPSSQAGRDVASWRTLAQDTQLNERTRRRQIHETLARPERPRLEQVLRPIYRDVLHADLDDPYLGLGETLFANYPFTSEDKGL